MRWRERCCVLLGRDDPPSDGLWGTERTERREGNREGPGNCPTRERRDPLESRESGCAQNAREGKRDDGRSADGDDWGTSGGIGSGGTRGWVSRARVPWDKGEEEQPTGEKEGRIDGGGSPRGERRSGGEERSA